MRAKVLPGMGGRMKYAWAVLVAGWLAPGALAQQNLFNVPSAEITPKNALFFQQQTNFNRTIQSNTTISYGFGSGFEGGLNILSVGLLPERGVQDDSNPPLLLFNFQKGIELSEDFKLGLGTQFGQSAPDRRVDVRLANFTYLTGVYVLPEELGKVYVGAYFANPAYRGGTGDPFGFMLGYDLPIIKDRFSLVGDYISGRSGISVAVLGGVVQLTENWQLSLGAQLPAPRSSNAYGAVLELTFVPGKKGD